MLKIEALKDHLYQIGKTPSPLERRRLVIDEMTYLNQKEIHCFKCTGTCCTMSANSMQITPIEAFEIILSLDISKENLIEFKNRLKENIQHYRLDHEIFLSKKAHSNLRKTYTCPFFVPGPKGCTIKKDLKPYGCLGFNPRIENDNGSQCHSDQSLLEKREQTYLLYEKIANDYLAKELGIDWIKSEIPKAVLFLIEKIYP